MLRNFKKYLTFSNLGIFGILPLAAFLRLYKIGDYMTFLGDEGRDVLVAYNILHGHFTLLGPTSSVGGFFLGPIYYYFMAPFLLLANYDPVGPAIMIAIFGILAVFFVYKIGSEFFNRTTGIVAAALFSVSPLVIAYSRSSWNPNPMPLFTLLTLYCLYKAIQKNSRLFFILTGILYGIDLQLHYIEVFVGVIIFVYIILSLQKKILQMLKDFLFVVCGFLIGFSPFLAFEVRHGFPDFRSIIAFVFHSQNVGSGMTFFGVITNVFFRLFGRLVTNFPPPEQVSIQANSFIGAWYYLTLVLAIASVGLLLWQLYKGKRQTEKFSQLLLIFLWLFFGVVLFGFYKKPIYDYYFEFMFPLPFLLVGNFLSFLFVKNAAGKLLGVVVFVILFTINLQAMPFRFEPNRQMMQVREISQFVLDETQGKPYNFALITNGNSDHAYRYFFTILGHPPITILPLDQDPKRTSVTSQLLIVCEIGDCHPLGYSLWEVAGFGRADIAGHWNVSVLQVYKLVHYKGK